MKNSSIAQPKGTRPNSVEVLPILFVPSSSKLPTRSQQDSFMHYIYWAQEKYRKMLKGRSTFKVGYFEPIIYLAKHSDSFYENKDKRFFRDTVHNTGSKMAAELLQYFHYNRYDCPYIFVVVYIEQPSSCPVINEVCKRAKEGSGIPFNGGFDKGGGIVIVSSCDLDRNASFGSTLLHEMGHAFGLPHVDAYKYNINDNPSVMSYDCKNQTNWFANDAKGTLIPEDIRGLSYNKLVFPTLYFDPGSDIPAGYTIYSTIVELVSLKLNNE